MVKINEDVKEFCRRFFKVIIDKEGFTLEELERAYKEYYLEDNSRIS